MKKSNFSKFQDQSTINMDSFDKRRFATMEDNSRAMQSLVDKAQIPGFSHLLSDIWGSLYKMSPQLKEEVPEHLKTNHSILNRIMNDEKFLDHRQHTRLDELTSAIGTVKLGEETNKWLEEKTKENEDLKEKMEEMQKALNSNRSGKPSKKTQEASQKLEQEILKALEQDSKGFSNAMQKAIEGTKETKDAVKKMLSHGSGNEEAELKKLPLRDQIKLAELLSSNKKMKEVAEWAGRMKAIARKKQKSQHKESIDRSGVTMGNEIERLLPAELMQFAHPITKLDFARRLVEKETLVFDQKGKEELGKGPIIVCSDQSGSMKELDSQAKGFALALMWIAKKQKRDFVFIPFSNKSEQHVYPKGKISIADMEKFATTFLNGGTRFQEPLSRAMKIIGEEKARFGKADIIFITDGDDVVDKSFIDQFNKTKEVKGFKVMSLVVGKVRSLDTVKSFSESIVHVTNFDNEDAFKAFQI